MSSSIETAFSPAVLTCISRLREHKAEVIHPDLEQYPLNKRAGVLILLFELNRDGILRVLLTTRSKSLRSHPGQTALPGGKMDVTDNDIVETALREAQEEIGLPLQSPHVHVLTKLRAFLSLYKLKVTPVVALLTDPSILGTLVRQETEVDNIFHHPLIALLDPSLMGDMDLSSLAEKGGPDWDYETDFHNTSDADWLRGSSYRLHRFRTTHTPIKGLTSDILIHAASICFDQQPSYERYAPTQLDPTTMISFALEDLGTAHSSDVAGLTTENRERIANA